MTVDPADDDQEVFGEAWELIQEWRQPQGDPPQPWQGPGLAVRVEERLLVGGAGVAGGPRADPAAGDLPAERVWTAAARSTGAGRRWRTRSKARKRRELLGYGCGYC